MDKGLDIGLRRGVLAFHASVPDSPRKLAIFVRRLASSLAHDATADATDRALEATARELACELDWAAAERAITWAEPANHHVLTIFDRDYPHLLTEISHPPVVLFVVGAPAALQRTQIAIVGSRKATHYGREAAFRIARGLAEHGCVVTSGMATGIDAAAHRGALAADQPTLAVFGCGIDRIYPRRHVALAEAIAANGALVSEFPLGSAPLPHHFPRRNRVISGLSIGTVVVEAALKSGSITTALHALEQSRDVFAVPGSVRNPLAAGCHALIQQGAILINDHADIIAQYPGRFRQRAAPAAAEARQSDAAAAVTTNEREVLDACAFDGASFDEIVRRSGLTAPEVSSILSALEVRGAVRSLAGNGYLRIAE